jgi:hypothetical protein
MDAVRFSQNPTQEVRLKEGSKHGAALVQMWNVDLCIEPGVNAANQRYQTPQHPNKD